MTEPETSQLPPTPTAVFTPADEPYLGCAGLQLFDELIVALMEQQHRVGPWTRTNRLRMSRPSWIFADMMHSRQPWCSCQR
jgi:hypothetical protein